MIKNLDSIKQKADIVSIIGTFITLEKHGGSYKACCPFHGEKTPSFSVSARKQVYHCFGCGKSGDVFQFVEDQMKIEFIEAVEYVAKEVGERVEYEKGRENFRQEYMAAKEAKTKLSDIVDDVFKFYYFNTWGSTPPFGWDTVDIDGRAYKGETIDKFKLAYAPPNALYKSSLEGRFKLEDLVNAALVKKNEENGGHWDHFSNRTLFPLHDPEGKVIGFTGRKQPDSPEKSAKYKNSQDSPVYNKSKYLYGLHQCGKIITKMDAAYIVEGQHDLLTMYENGFRNVVATSGTALTKHHAKVLNRYCDTVILLFDGDDAGISAAARGVEVLADMVSVKVCILKNPENPENKIDPCEYIRKYGAEKRICDSFDSFKEALSNHTQDGILWAIMREWDKTDLKQQHKCFQEAGRILSTISQTKRDMYIRALSAKDKMGAGVKKMLEDICDEFLAKSAPQSNFSRAQQDQILRYGVYVNGRQYYVPNEDGSGSPISNFHIKSMLLIDGNATSERVIEMENVNGLKVIARIRADIFTDLGAFRAWCESRGYFMLRVKNEQWTSIRDLTYDKMTVAYPITVLGYHREGFYVFRNGIFDGDVFQPCNDMGVVQAGTDHYLITSSANFDNSKADDGNEKNQTNTFMQYTANHGHGWSLHDWGSTMRQCYGDKSIPGIAYYITALFRDIIFEKFTYFPHFNVFGVKGSGKNYFLESLMSCFGRVEPPTDLTNTTEKALPRILASVRNSLIWFDEYKNSLEPQIISALRGAYGASGRTTAEASMDNNTRRFQPRSGLIISGEDRPTRDIALYSRCCAVETEASVFTTTQIQAVERLKEVEKTGNLVSITLHLLKFREHIKDNFYHKFREIRDGLLDLTAGKQVESRILANWAVIISAAECLRDIEAIPWELHEILDIAVERITYQSQVVVGEDHLANFWRITAYLLEDNKVQHNQDIIVQAAKTVKIWGKNSREKITYNTPDSENAKFLFVRLARIHPLYMQHISMQQKTTGLQIGTLEHYIMTSKWYVGKCHKKFRGESQVCFVLRASEDFPVDLVYSKDVEEDSPFDF